MNSHPRRAATRPPTSLFPEPDTPITNTITARLRLVNGHITVIDHTSGPVIHTLWLLPKKQARPMHHFPLLMAARRAAITIAAAFWRSWADSRHARGESPRSGRSSRLRRSAVALVAVALLPAFAA